MKILRFDPSLHFLVFTHIPKCGGTSVHECLKLMMPDKYIVNTPNMSLADIDADYWGMGGHFNFCGVPPRILNGRQPIYMTILRHPFDRFTSFFNHVAACPGHYAHKAIPEFFDHTPEEILLTWEKLDFREVNDLQTQMICNKAPEMASVNAATDIINQHYRFVTTVDYIDDMLGDIAAFLGVDKPDLYRLNTTRADSKQNLNDPVLYERVIKMNQKDLLLYRYVSSRLNENRLIESKAGR